MGQFSVTIYGATGSVLNDIQHQIQVLRERYADTGELAFIAMMRFDVALSHPESFHKVSGVTP